MKKTKHLPSALILIFVIGIAIGAYHKEIFYNAKWSSVNTTTNKINVCFTPPSGCGLLIAQELSKAKESIYIQAFGLTAQPIVDELIKAKRNGVQIRVLLDRTNLTDKYSKIHELKRAGIDVSIDLVPGIAHNKVIVIDKSKVITGSYNFTNNADKRNAENVVLIDDVIIAEAYIRNWLNRKADN